MHAATLPRCGRGLACVLLAISALATTSVAQPLPVPPRSAAESAGPASRAAGIQPRIYIFRGFADVFSLGMNDLGLRLLTLGYEPLLETHTKWEQVAGRAVADYRADPGHVRIAIIGHSLGANAAIAMAAFLGSQGVPVALLATYDPTFTGLGASRNVARTINFYSGGTLGFPLEERPGTRVENVDRTDLSHVEIAKAPELHAATIAAIVAALGAPPTATAPER